MEHSAGAESCYRYGEGVCVSGSLVWPRIRDAAAGYDQNIAAAGAEADGISWALHVEEFRRVRESTISLCRNMPGEAWARTGIASENRVSVRALAYIIAGHVEHHNLILRERYW